VGTTNSKPLGPIINDRPIRNIEPQSGPIFYLLLIFGTKQFAKMLSQRKGKQLLIFVELVKN
jgi:hypothetical protein